MPNIYLVVAALVAAIACSFFGYQAGESANEGKHAIADRAAQDKFEAALAAANLKLRTAEQAHTDDSAKASEEYQKLKKEKDDAAKKSIAAIASGERKLYVYANCKSPTSDSTLSQATTNSSGIDGAIRVELPPALGASVLSIGAEADSVADLFRRCQVELANDRKVYQAAKP